MEEKELIKQIDVLVKKKKELEEEIEYLKITKTQNIATAGLTTIYATVICALMSTQASIGALLAGSLITGVCVVKDSTKLNNKENELTLTKVSLNNIDEYKYNIYN